MKNRINLGLAKRIILSLLIILTVLYVVSGFGITEFRAVETLTFGLLNKNLAFKIHNGLTIPAAIVLILHILVNIISRQREKS